MGIAASKVCKQLPHKDFQEGSIPSTPIVAPKVIKHESLDPRSPSTHISRTPLQLLTEATLKLNELEDNLVTNVDETPSKTRTIFLGIDPRSPTAEFKRTPIIINVSESNTTDKIQNKNLEKVKRSGINTTPKSTFKKQTYEKTSSPMAPKLLESSPIIAKLNTNKRKSFAGMLETNIDFTETDLDAVIREKSKVKENIHTSDEVVTPKHKQFIIIQKEDLDPRSPTTDFLRTPIQIIKKMSNLDLNNESESNCIEKETSYNEIDIELEDHAIIERCVQEICEKVHLTAQLQNYEKRQLLETNLHETITPAEVPIIDERHKNPCNQKMVWCHNQDAIDSEIPFEIKSAPISPKPTNGNLKSASEVLKKPKSAPVSPPLVSLSADVKEFDKKLTNLIYHDEDVIICPRKVKLKDYDTRSPLRNINSSEPVRKLHKLKVNDRIKSEYAVSKIPVFKEKNKTEVQCENTPPRNMEKRKVKVARKSHWDNADTTLII